MPHQVSRGRAGKGPGVRKEKRKTGTKSELVGRTKQAATSLSRMSEASMPLFPPRTHKSLRYHNNINLVMSSGTVTTAVFKVNDLFQPEASATHQPMGFDQMMVFYNHFAVDYTTITANFVNTAAGCVRVGIRLDASPTALTTIDRIIEFGGNTTDLLEAKNTYGCSKTLSASCDVAKVQGIPKQNITTDPNMRGDAGTSPAELSYFHVYCWDPNGQSGTVNVDFVLDYSSFFMEPRDFTTSTPLSRPTCTETKSPPCPPGWVCVRQ